MRVLEQGQTLLFKADVWVNPETTDTTEHVAARQVFAKLSMSREQRGVAMVDQRKHFDPGG